jgi:RNA polymerase sigma-70 factor (ECF subfamily)
VGLNDEALLAGMAAGDPQAAASLVRRYQARVYGLALTIVGVPATAEDVAQEVFLRAWRFAGGYDPRRGTVLTWLLTIARNASLDMLRMSRDRPYEPESLPAILLAQDAGDDEQVGRLDDVERIRCALRTLPDEQASAVVLATFYGMTAREIAERAGVPLGTAKTRIRLGLARLRNHLEVNDD